MIIFQKKLFFLITFLLTSNFLFADPCSLPENTISLDGGDVWYNVNTDIAGFQFEVDGTTVSGASGGDAASAGFTVSENNGIVVGFSLTGATISAGTGSILNVKLPLSVGFINIPAFLIFIPITMFMAKVGANSAHKIDKTKLQVFFGIFLYVVGTIFVLRYSGL